MLNVGNMLPDSTPPVPAQSPRALRAATSRTERDRRQSLASRLAEPHDGVITLRMLLDAGLTRGQIQSQVERGAWRRVGRHTVTIDGVPQGRALWWTALWESGERSVLDGPTALLAAGLQGWTERDIHVAVPNDARVRARPGIRHHRLQEVGPTLAVGGLRRTRPDVAVVRAAQWAASDRQAATLLAMCVQQRLTTPAALQEQWDTIGYSVRRELIDSVIRDACDGAHSLGEIDFARLCRSRGLPEPDRQVLRVGERGAVFLDVLWEEQGVHVEVQGAHHYEASTIVADALRANDLDIEHAGLVTLQVPVLGLRVCPERFLDQVERALRVGRRTA